MNIQDNPDDPIAGNSRAIVKAALGLVSLMIVMLAVLFLAAGRLNWWEAWVYVGQALLVLIVSRVVMILKNPDTAMERARAAQIENVKTWDKVLMPLTAIYLPIISWVVAGLDERFGWSPDLPDFVQIVALVLMFLGSMFSTWAMLANRFFSSHVRIQTDRNHSVVSSGPYRFVRHPGYAGAIFSWVVSPVFFSSYWVVIPAVLAMIANIRRTSLEDQTLQDELPGYKEYTRRVGYRLVPGIW